MKWLHTKRTRFRVSLFQLVLILLAIPTMGFMTATYLNFRSWQIQTYGQWAPGTVVAVTQCTFNSVSLHIRFTDSHGVRQVLQSDCLQSHLHVGQPTPVRYLPGNPQYILLPTEIDPGRERELIKWSVLLGVSGTPFAAAFCYQVVINRRQHRQRLAQQGALVPPEARRPSLAGDRDGARQTVPEFVQIVPALGICLAFGSTFNTVQQQSAEWRLLYAGVTYCVAVVIALVLPWLYPRNTRRFAKQMLVYALLILVLTGPFFGSITGTFALIEVLHQPYEGSHVIFAVLAWAALEFPLIWWLTRGSLHLQRHS